MAMSGGTINHGIIGNNINTELNNSIKAQGSDCLTINGDVRIFIESTDSFVYPDGMVICGPIETSEKDQNSVANPVLIIEVLSKSTESYDRGDKFHKYCSLPSFKEYVLIDQYKPVIDVLYRADSTYWKMDHSVENSNSKNHFSGLQETVLFFSVIKAGRISSCSAAGMPICFAFFLQVFTTLRRLFIKPSAAFWPTLK